MVFFLKPRDPISPREKHGTNANEGTSKCLPSALPNCLGHETEKESRGHYADRITECHVPWVGASLEQEMAMSEKLGASEQNRDFSWFPTVTNEVRLEGQLTTSNC